MSWDAQNGVWVGDRAIAASAEDLPNPLYLFGYGSLIWRSGDILADMKTYHCKCESWRRVFAQKSMDHRGRPAFPGLVLNIISDEYLKANNLKEAGDDIPSSCVGVLYHIPEAATQATVEELDFRERGGYQRHIVTVKLLEDTHMHKIGDFVDVLVYIGSADNPNFTYDPSEEWYDRKVNIISAAYGPSGTNRDYLFPLVQFLHKNKYEDPYLYQLEQSVRMRLGRWKGRVGAETPPEALAESVNLWGWGSMEYGQMSLSSSLICKETLHNIYGAAVIGTLTISGPPKPFRFVALAGGSHSGCIVDDCLYLWGNQIHGQVGPGRLNCGVVGASLGHEHSVVLCNSGAVIAFGDDSYAQCSGGREAAPYFLKYMTSWPSPMLGFDILGEYNVDAMACWEQLQCNYAGLCHDLPKVIQVCAGVKHSAAITEDGHVYTWGGGRHARLLLSSAEPWRPLADAEGTVALIDVALGCNHTVALDSRGKVWTWGSNNRHLQLGRSLGESLDPQIVALPENVIWQRVTSGWSHSAVRGVHSDGSMCIYIWGRADMGATACGSAEPILPRELPSLPSGEGVQEVWCGSEFTMVCTKSGQLWSCGWNEHGNLGVGHNINSIASGWKAVVKYPETASNDCRLLAVWDGALSCGGGHCIALLDSCV